ncbi:TPA: hypothetical protein NPQ01_001148 [Klebsiella variicola subsp. variicola]|uniref:hypothetical protein n=1 Tax=Klebsiella pneumoniae TaxID=573 RepID=UPI000F6C9A03|nr:hypothetical protein [Klebsiella pneumoniae]VED93737.1 Uncharacterised protein [Klebsiella pneumoniae]HCI6059303.1 hypothetical protein [Klebsiella pneumoniae]HCI6940986.1 hypothetical protein [Klebsiella variicola subsp. variicola]
MVNSNYLLLGDKNRYQKICTDADEVEFSALLEKFSTIDNAIADEQIAGTLEDEILDDENQDDELKNSEEEWMIEDRGKDNIISDVAEELQRRARILKGNYPFIYEDNHLRLKKTYPLSYILCLCISMAENITEGKNTRLPRFFEIFAGAIFTRFFGEEAKHMHTGWPRSHKNPKEFQKLFKKLKRLINFRTLEWHWMPQAGLTNGDAGPIKDGGVDFVSWKHFFDGRDGLLFALGQCACGNNWNTKFSDINIKRLQNFFHPLSYVSCVKVFTTPFVLCDGMLKTASEDAGIVLDRIRLTIIHEKYLDEFVKMDEELKEIIEYCIEKV